jgi:hypothetical protein
MNLLFPTFLGAAAAAGLPLLLHLLRTRMRKQVPFPSLRFLGMSALRDSRRQSLRKWLVLLLRCLAIALIVLAFARPFWRLAHTDQSRSVVVVLDGSYSMDASGRRNAIAAWLAPQLAALRPPDQLGVIALQPDPVWLVPLGGRLEDARSAAAKLPRTYESANYRAGIDLAATALSLATTKHRQILLAGDEQRIAWQGVAFDRPLPPGIELIPAPVAPPPKMQAALVDLHASRIGDDQLAFDVTIQSFDREPHDRVITYYVGETSLGTSRCTVTPGPPVKHHATFANPAGNGPLAVRAALDPDDLATDDVAYATIPTAESRRVALAPIEDASRLDFIDRALRAVRPHESLTTFQPQALALDAAVWSATAVTVLRGAAPFRAGSAKALDAFLEAGGSAWVLCDGSPEQSAWLATQGIQLRRAAPVAPETALKLRDFALDHSLFAPFDGHSLAPLFEPAFVRGWALEGKNVDALARWSDGGVAIAEVAVGSGRLLVTGFELGREDSDFPVRAGFVPFVHRAVTWLAEGAPEPPAGRVGAIFTLPGAGTWRPVLSPQPNRPIEVNGFVAPAAPGVYEFKQGDMVEWYAINLDPAESNLEPWPVPSDFARLNSGKPAPNTPRPPGTPMNLTPANADDPTLVDERDAWWWLLAAAIGVLLIELSVANRTVL